jgi:hypothetical protein
MIDKLTKLKYWEIAALGISVTVTAILLVAFATRWFVGTWPQTDEAAHIAYVIVSAAVAWVSSGIFVEAIFLKHRLARIAGALDNVMDRLAGFTEGAGKHRAEEADRG